MTMRDPHVEIEYDGIDCENTLTRIDNMWHCRYIQDQIDKAGWTTKGNKHFCERCQEANVTKKIDNRDIICAYHFRGLKIE